MGGTFRVLEMFCGIGGCAAALGEAASVVAAVDINRNALKAYAYNFSHTTVACSVESIPTQTLCDWRADLWWLSPPCQPYTTRGRKRDLEDPRAASLLALIPKIGEVRPAFLALENVPGFRQSRVYERLMARLHLDGYTVRERLVCPTELGLPNRRRRFYLVAARKRLCSWTRPPIDRFSVGSILQTQVDPHLDAPAIVLRKYRQAIHIVARNEDQVTNCFTSAYGRSYVRSGSYLSENGRIRRFSPQEILRILGFPSGYRLPTNLSLRQAWPLAGNSLCVPAVRHILSCIPELRALGMAREDDRVISGATRTGVEALLSLRPPVSRGGRLQD